MFGGPGMPWRYRYEPGRVCRCDWSSSCGRIALLGLFAGFFFHQPAAELKDVVGASNANRLWARVGFDDDDIFDIFEQHFPVHAVNQITRVSADIILASELSHSEVVVLRIDF